MNSHSELSIVILAAGQGSRMKSRLPKVLHKLGGKPLLQHVIDTANELRPKQIIVVYGHGGEMVPETIHGENIIWKRQTEQLGTGHAVEQAIPLLTDEETILVLYGDVPLVRTETLADLVRLGSEGFGLLTVHLDSPAGYGRLVRDIHGSVKRIVEEKDASDEIKKITEVNTGILCCSAQKMREWIRNLENDNAQGEYYLTDTIEMSVNNGIPVKTTHPVSEAEVTGVNSRSQLAQLEREFQRIQANQLMDNGVSVIDPARLDIRGKINAGQDVIIDINVIFEGEVTLGNNVQIGAGCVISNTQIMDNVIIKAMSVIESAMINKNCMIGPFARIRPGTELASNAHVGNFVEIKNSNIGSGSKVNHLSYIGDTTMGDDVNVGAGTITCNYDGANKHRTVIGNKVFIGSDSQLVAPVEVGDGATIGAGTTLTSNASVNDLTLSRIKQKTIKGWKRPTKKGKSSQ